MEVRVKPGGRVGTAEVLGTLAIDTDLDASELHFEVWRERDTQDPSGWVKGL